MGGDIADRGRAAGADPASAPLAAGRHVTVCVCTYRRPAALGRLLEALARQTTDGLFTYSVVVVDNDRGESARAVVREAANTVPPAVAYVVEPVQGIAQARNTAVESAEGEFVAFIDDDEIPVAGWLSALVRTCEAHGVDGVLGPVKPRFDTPPPEWIRRGRFYERPNHPTGFVIGGEQGRTGNVLLRRALFRRGEPAFRTEFVTGEDQDFFRRRIAEGRVFVWSREAEVFEVVPPARWRRTYVLRKALMRGRYSLLEPRFGVLDAAKSVVAVVVYTAGLPIWWLGGAHHLMRYLEKLCFHGGKLLACLGLNPVGATYVSE
jgi:glycosyltransferase involved in cell wall biosynthesis